MREYGILNSSVESYRDVAGGRGTMDPLLQSCGRTLVRKRSWLCHDEKWYDPRGNTGNPSEGCVVRRLMAESVMHPPNSPVSEARSRISGKDRFQGEMNENIATVSLRLHAFTAEQLLKR